MPRPDTLTSATNGEPEVSSVLIRHSDHSKSIRYDAPEGASGACMRSAYVNKAVLDLLGGEAPQRVRITIERA